MNLNTRSDCSLNFQRLNIYLLKKVVCLFLWFVGGPTPTGTGTIILDPTFGSFTLLEPVSHYRNRFLW